MCCSGSTDGGRSIPEVGTSLAHERPASLGARKRTVSVSLNSDLYAKAKRLGINLSKVAEEALAQALARRLAEQAKVEIDRDLKALSDFVEAHGSFSDMVREHYAAVEDDAAV